MLPYFCLFDELVGVLVVDNVLLRRHPSLLLHEWMGKSEAASMRFEQQFTDYPLHASRHLVNASSSTEAADRTSSVTALEWIGK